MVDSTIVATHYYYYKRGTHHCFSLFSLRLARLAAAKDKTVLYGKYPAVEADLCQAALGKKKSRGGGGAIAGKTSKGNVARDKISAGLRSQSPVNGEHSKGKNPDEENDEDEEEETGVRTRNIVGGRHGKAAEMFGDLMSLMRARMDYEQNKSTGRQKGVGSTTDASSDLEKEKLTFFRGLNVALERHETREGEKHEKWMALLDKWIGATQLGGDGKNKNKN